MKNITTNEQRLWDSLMQMGEIGGTEKGGCCRLALTDLDKQARDLFTQWCEEAGCTVRVDKMGNVFARRPGKNNDLPPVATRSWFTIRGGNRSRSCLTLVKSCCPVLQQDGELFRTWENRCNQQIHRNSPSTDQ